MEQISAVIVVLRSYTPANAENWRLLFCAPKSRSAEMNKNATKQQRLWNRSCIHCQLLRLLLILLYLRHCDILHTYIYQYLSGAGQRPLAGTIGDYPPLAGCGICYSRGFKVIVYFLLLAFNDFSQYLSILALWHAADCLLKCFYAIHDFCVFYLLIFM